MLFCLAELTLGMLERMGMDLEAFSNHAKRKTVSVEDVLLCARRNPQLLELMQNKLQEIQSSAAHAESESTSAHSSKKRKKLVKNASAQIQIDSD
jgi:hypothetical protein